jgi:hypothetical protein
LVQKAFRDEQTGRYVVVFDPDMLHLFQAGYTLIDAGQRQALGKGSLAKWLHGFYASHAKPFDYKVETIHKLCGSSAVLKAFRQSLKSSLDALVLVGGLVSWRINPETDLLSVVRIPSPAQLKHLRKSKKTS